MSLIAEMVARLERRIADEAMDNAPAVKLAARLGEAQATLDSIERERAAEMAQVTLRGQVYKTAKLTGGAVRTTLPAVKLPTPRQAAEQGNVRRAGVEPVRGCKRAGGKHRITRKRQPIVGTMFCPSLDMMADMLEGKL